MWYLREVQHTGAESRGGAEQSLNEAAAQLKPVGYAPQVGFFQYRKQHQSEIHATHHHHVRVLKHNDTLSGTRRPRQELLSLLKSLKVNAGSRLHIVH